MINWQLLTPRAPAENITVAMSAVSQGLTLSANVVKNTFRSWTDHLAEAQRTGRIRGWEPPDHKIAALDFGAPKNSLLIALI